MTALKDSFTSTGEKFFHQQEAMAGLRSGKARCVVTHLMPTDTCQHTCAFCSVQTRVGASLPIADMIAYLVILKRFGLKAVILSGGGNPILYRCPKTKVGFNELVERISELGLEMGLITNGMPMRQYERDGHRGRTSWRSVAPETLDKLKWIRISMSGLDHQEGRVYVPEVDPEKTTLGFSYVLHDIYSAPDEPNHGKVSTPEDLARWSSGVKAEGLKLKAENGEETARVNWGTDRLPWIQEQIQIYVDYCKPRYVRLLPNCLEPSLIPERCAQLQHVANAINPDVVFVQYKPPEAPNKCFLGYVHPVLNSDGYVYPCDSCVLNEAADHKFANPWRICHWSEIASIYEQPVRSLIADPKMQCPGCVFTASNLLLEKVVNGTVDYSPHGELPIHVNFV